MKDRRGAVLAGLLIAVRAAGNARPAALRRDRASGLVALVSLTTVTDRGRGVVQFFGSTSAHPEPHGWSTPRLSVPARSTGSEGPGELLVGGRVSYWPKSGCQHHLEYAQASGPERLERARRCPVSRQLACLAVHGLSGTVNEHASRLKRDRQAPSARHPARGRRGSAGSWRPGRTVIHDGREQRQPTA